VLSSPLSLSLNLYELHVFDQVFSKQRKDMTQTWKSLPRVNFFIPITPQSESVRPLLSTQYWRMGCFFILIKISPREQGLRSSPPRTVGCGFCQFPSAIVIGYFFLWDKVAGECTSHLSNMLSRHSA
jgi:hypothetical protein